MMPSRPSGPVCAAINSSTTTSLPARTRSSWQTLSPHKAPMSLLVACNNVFSVVYDCWPSAASGGPWMCCCCCCITHTHKSAGGCPFGAFRKSAAWFLGMQLWSTGMHALCGTTTVPCTVLRPKQRSRRHRSVQPRTRSS